MKLYSYWRSTTSFRVRAALALKGLSYDYIPVDLLAGDQHDVRYAAINPNRGVPSLLLDDGTTLTQSLAIIDYLDAVSPPRLLPDEPVQRARVLAAAHTIALDIHPLTNLRVVQHLRATLDASEDQVGDWMLHWVKQGFAAVEAIVDPETSFAFGDTPDLADLCIVSQAYNAHRWGLDMAAFPRLSRIEAACLAHPAIATAHPDQQPDAA